MESHPPIIIISGAIGSGKGTIVHAIVRELGLDWIPTHTTRPVRQDDAILSHRIFETEANFLRYLARGEFIESVELAGYRYGLLRTDLEKELRLNKPVVLEMTVDGGIEVVRQYPNTLLIFLLTNEKNRHERINPRSMDHHMVQWRMKEATREEKLAGQQYHYLVENIEGHPEAAIEAVKKIIFKHFPALQW